MKVDVSLALLCKNYKVLKMDYKKHPCVRLFHAFGGKNEVKLHFWQIRIQPAKHRPSPREAWTMKYLIEKCFFFKTEATEKKRYIWIVLICIVFATFAIFVWFISSFFLKKYKIKIKLMSVYDTLGIVGLRSSLSQRRDVQSSAVPVTVSQCLSVMRLHRYISFLLLKEAWKHLCFIM